MADRCAQPVDRRKQQQGQSGRAEQAANDHGCQRALDFAAGGLRQRHGNEAKRRDQGGHQDGGAAVAPQLARWLRRAYSLGLHASAECHQHQSVEDRDAEQSDEATPAEMLRNLPCPQSDHAADDREWDVQ